MNIKAIANKIGIDYEKVVEDFCGDISTLGARIENFASSDFANKLNAYLDSSDYENTKALSHSIRKDAEKIGLDSIAKSAKRVEDADSDKIKNATLILIEKIKDATSIIENPN